MRYTGDSRYTKETGLTAGVWSGFVPYPPILMDGLTVEQRDWQQNLYRRAYAQAYAACGYRKLAPSFGREARN